MRFLVAALAVALLVLAGCGQQTAASGGSGTSAGGGGSATGQTADYDFTATTLDGDQFQGTSLEGKPTVLWFWAPWCPTCRSQIPAVTSLADEYEGKVQVVGVGGMADEPEIRELARKEISNVPHLIDSEGAVWQHFGVSSTSTFTVIGADGTIRSQGHLQDSELADTMERLAG